MLEKPRDRLKLRHWCVRRLFWKAKTYRPSD